MWKEITNRLEVLHYLQQVHNGAERCFLSHYNYEHFKKSLKLDEVRLHLKMINAKSNEFILRPEYQENSIYFKEGDVLELNNLRRNIFFHVKVKKAFPHLLFCEIPNGISIRDERKDPRKNISDLNFKCEFVNLSVIDYKKSHHEKIEVKVNDLSHFGMGVSFTLDRKKNYEEHIKPLSSIEIVTLNNQLLLRKIKGHIVHTRLPEQFNNSEIYLQYLIGFHMDTKTSIISLFNGEKNY
jgi:hypothetical protein